MEKKLAKYIKKRDFTKTPEPKKNSSNSTCSSRIFVIQKHFARSLHYDFRLEVEDVLKSWAIPKGIPKDPTKKRLAIQTDDHPLDYANFSGTIPEGEYGAGKVEIWDKGTYENLKKYKNGKEIPMTGCVRKGHIEIYLYGRKCRGSYALIHFKENNWLLIKMKKHIP